VPCVLCNTLCRVFCVTCVVFCVVFCVVLCCVFYWGPLRSKVVTTAPKLRSNLE